MRQARNPGMRVRAVVVALWIAGAAAIAAPHASGARHSAGQLRAGVHQQRDRARALSASVGALSALIGSLERQIALVAGRERAVRAQLASERDSLARVQASLATQQRLALRFAKRLARARVTLAHQLIGSYETEAPDVLGVVLSARGFSDLVERLDFLHQARKAQQAIIKTARVAKRGADFAALRLGLLQTRGERVAAGVAAQVGALAAMDHLLQGKRATLARARAVQTAALDRTRRRAQALQRSLTALLAQQSRASAPAGSGTQSFGSWAIPAPVVMCESGGQNLPPNSAGASGYYQILPSTWKGMGGSGPAAYLAGKAEQDRVAAALWAGGRGASNWVCAALVGAG